MTTIRKINAGEMDALDHMSRDELLGLLKYINDLRKHKEAEANWQRRAHRKFVSRLGTETGLGANAVRDIWVTVAREVPSPKLKGTYR